MSRLTDFAALLLVHLSATIFLAAPKAYACASCGSGSEEFFVLYPNEQLKVGISNSFTSAYSYRNFSGESFESAGADSTMTEQMTVGTKIFPQFDVYTSIGYVTNFRDSSHQGGIADPSLSSRWTLVQQDFSRSLIPQVQLMFGIKPSWARSARSAEDQKYLLDATGSGYKTVKLGVDLWQGMSRLRYGASLLQIYSIAGEFGRSLNADEQPIPLTRITASIGSSWSPVIKFVAGASAEFGGNVSLNSTDAVAYGVRRNLILFLTHDYFLSPTSVVRLTLSRAGVSSFSKDVTAKTTGSLNFVLTI